MLECFRHKLPGVVVQGRPGWPVKPHNLVEVAARIARVLSQAHCNLAPALQTGAKCKATQEKSGLRRVSCWLIQAATGAASLWKEPRASTPPQKKETERKQPLLPIPGEIIKLLYRDSTVQSSSRRAGIGGRRMNYTDLVPLPCLRFRITSRWCMSDE